MEDEEDKDALDGPRRTGREGGMPWDPAGERGQRRRAVPGLCWPGLAGAVPALDREVLEGPWLAVGRPGGAPVAFALHRCHPGSCLTFRPTARGASPPRAYPPW